MVHIEFDAFLAPVDGAIGPSELPTIVDEDAFVLLQPCNKVRMLPTGTDNTSASGVRRQCNIELIDLNAFIERLRTELVNFEVDRFARVVEAGASGEAGEASMLIKLASKIRQEEKKEQVAYSHALLGHICLGGQVQALVALVFAITGGVIAHGWRKVRVRTRGLTGGGALTAARRAAGRRTASGGAGAAVGAGTALLVGIHRE